MLSLWCRQPLAPINSERWLWYPDVLAAAGLAPACIGQAGSLSLRLLEHERLYDPGLIFESRRSHFNRVPVRQNEPCAL